MHSAAYVMAVPSTGSRRIAVSCLAGLALGAGMTAAGLAWSRLASDRRVWSQQQAEAYQAAFEAVHAATSGEAGERPPDQDFTNLQQRYRALAAELNQARRVRDVWGLYVTRSGLVLALLSGLGYLAVRSN